MEIAFLECILCNKRIKNPTETDLFRWDFGVDLDEIEVDDDGGVRGLCPECKALVRE